MTILGWKRTEKKSARKGEPITEMRISWGWYKLTFWIEGPLSKSFRRTTCLTIFKAIKPLLRLKSFDIFHHDSSEMSQFSAFARERDLSEAVTLKSHAGLNGAAIRFKRLELGWTLADLAKRAQMNLGHLSEIEHGRHRARPQTLKRIAAAFEG